MKRNLSKPATLQLPEELRQEKERLLLSQNATAEEILFAINHYLPKTRNLPENLAMLRHLGLTENEIADLLSGGNHYLYGEIRSFNHSTVKIVCSCVKVSIDEIGRDYVVCLNGKPAEVFIRKERERQRSLEMEMEESTKEELIKEIKTLRKEIKKLNEYNTTTKHLNETLIEFHKLSSQAQR